MTLESRKSKKAFRKLKKNKKYLYNFLWVLEKLIKGKELG